MAVLSLTLASQKTYAHDMQEIVVTADKFSISSDDAEMAKEKLKKIAGSTHVIEKKDFEQSKALTIKDMTDYTAGVYAQSRTNQEARLSIRGSGLSRNFHLRGLNFYQDGIPLNMADGSADFQNIDPLAYDHIEVLKGGNATQMGTASLGGAMNFVTPTGYNSDKLSLRAEGGSYGMYRTGISSGQVHGDNDYYFNLNRASSDGYREQSALENTMLNMNIGHKLRDDLETRIYFTYADVNQELSGNLTKQQLKDNPKSANGFSKMMNYQRDYKSYRVANKTSYVKDNFEINGGVYAERKDLYHPIFQLIDQENHNFGSFINATFDTEIAGYRNEVFLGNVMTVGYNDSQRFISNAGGYGAKSYAQNETAKTATFYAENRFYPQDDLALIAGSQFLYTTRDVNDKFLSNGDQSGHKDYSGISPKIGVLWDVTPQIQTFANMSMAYEPPTFSEVTQTSLMVSGLADIEAQKSTTLEIGTRGDYHNFGWDASIYHAWLKDEIMLYQVGMMGMSAANNADKSYHQGFEFSGHGTLAENLLTGEDNLETRLAYTYSNFHFDGDSVYGDNAIPGMPKHYIRTELRYNHPIGAYLAPNIEYVPQGYYVDMANTEKSDSYVAFGLRTGYDVNEKLSLFLDARNLADKRYAEIADVVTTFSPANSAIYSPAIGRSFFAGLQAKF